MARKRKPKFVKFKSKFEAEIAQQLTALNIEVQYEVEKLHFTVPETVKTYNPDFKIKDKVFIESKGKFDAQDRKKHLFLKEQLYPKGIKIHIVFQNANQRISKKSKTTYADWCEKHGISYSHKIIKKEWLK